MPATGPGPSPVGCISARRTVNMLSPVWAWPARQSSCPVYVDGAPEDHQNMRIAVTGGSGRIGAAVVSLAVAQGHQVVSIDRVTPSAEQAASSGVEFVAAELADYPSYEQAIAG